MNSNTLLTSLYNTTFPPKRSVMRVNGVQEARDFKLENDESIALIDANEDILYIKECDNTGRYSLKIYQCIDKTDEYISKCTPANISRAEFDSLKTSLDELKTLLTKGGKKNEHNVQKQSELDFANESVQ
jgi:hypothetical protein